MVQILNDNSFNEEINKEGVIVVDFFASWCGPCKMLAPVFEDLSNEMGDNANFFKVDIDQSLELARTYGINTVPTMLVFKNGEVVDKMVGFMPKESLRSKISEQL
ncbi:thioredoxin [Asaccharospora irregularis]|uniref:Thioredoxin n=1 Tax=Asaccharospora irregularis DSM 2635 TaxID=1121321 RepID=A0A1M5LTF2_9FIRM|nr:thioredoxin [Asaccharospora irregularis]SHG67643.1 thioredoxin [Asaccharospora irregularis DSM 2635]